MADDGRKRPDPPGTGERKAADAWDDPGGKPGGSVSAEDVARPRDREAVEGVEDVVPGFTTTGPSGSQSGRSLHGVAPEDEDPRADEK